MAILPSNNGNIDKKTEEKIKNIDKALKGQVGKTKKKSKKKIFIVLGILIVSSILLLVFLGFNLISKLNKVDIDESNLAAKPIINTKIKNIALFGVDSYEGGGRSDSIMILSIDIGKKQVKLSSVLRDSYVKINEYGYDKINHAYRFGGAELAIRTLNENYHLDITDYITVDFANLAHIIDAMGGITIDISDEEFYYMKMHIEDTARDMKVPPIYVKKSGIQEVNGLQAVSFARIRKIGGDIERTERQRKVMEALMKKALETPITSYYGVLSKLLEYVETSLDIGELMNLSKVASPALELKQYSMPSEDDLLVGGGGSRKINGIFYFVYDLYEASDNLHSFIYGGDSSKISDEKPSNYYLPKGDRPTVNDPTPHIETPDVEVKKEDLFIPFGPPTEDTPPSNDENVEKPSLDDESGNNNQNLPSDGGQNSGNNNSSNSGDKKHLNTKM